jgi:hypothetical protein
MISGIALPDESQKSMNLVGLRPFVDKPDLMARASLRLGSSLSASTY